MNASDELTNTSLLETLEGGDGHLNRKGFPMLATMLDKKYASPGVYVVRWLPGSQTVELSDGRKIPKSPIAR